MPHAHNLVLCVDMENTLKILTPHAHNLVLCVDIENTLKILKNTHAHNLVLCVDIENTLKILVKFVPQITGINLDGSYVCFPDTTTSDMYS